MERRISKRKKAEHNRDALTGQVPVIGKHEHDWINTEDDRGNNIKLCVSCGTQLGWK